MPHQNSSTRQSTPRPTLPAAGPAPSGSGSSISRVDTQMLLGQIAELNHTVGSLNACLRTLKECSSSTSAPVPSPAMICMASTQQAPARTPPVPAPHPPHQTTLTTPGIPTALPLLAIYPRENKPDCYQA